MIPASLRVRTLALSSAVFSILAVSKIARADSTDSNGEDVTKLAPIVVDGIVAGGIGVSGAGQKEDEELADYGAALIGEL